MKLVVALALALAFAAGGCFARSAEECRTDADCEGECARTGECVAAGTAIEVVIRWTIGGVAASDDSCSSIAELEVVFYDGEHEATSYAPIPCLLGRATYDKMPPRLDGFELLAYDGGGRVVASGGGAIEPTGTTTVTVDLAP